jgi:hypothetical protein
MKKISLIVASVAVLLGTLAAMPSQAFACYCEAESVDGWGWGQHQSCAVAQQWALEECASVTWENHWCRVTYCN